MVPNSQKNSNYSGKSTWQSVMTGCVSVQTYLIEIQPIILLIET